MPGGLFVKGLVPSPLSGHRAAALPSFAGGIEPPLGPRGERWPAAYYPLAAAPIFLSPWLLGQLSLLMEASPKLIFIQQSILKMLEG